MHVEAELEALLERLAPGCSQHWIGASTDEIDEIEAFVGQPLTPFYRWFLTRMGQSMGPLTYPKRDMSVKTLLAIYRSGFSPPSPNLLLVASEEDDIMPMYMYCDLAQPTRDDALVCSFEKKGGARQDEFETLRERFAWSMVNRFRLAGCEQECSGTLRDGARTVLDKLEPVLANLQFETVHRTGPRCGVYERPDAVLSCVVPAAGQTKRYMFFDLGGEPSVLRWVLGTIGAETDLEIEVDEWTPSLPT